MKINNVVECHCGLGFYELFVNGLQNDPGGDIWHFDIAGWRSSPKMAMCLDRVCSDNEKVTIESDESFKTTSSPLNIYSSLKFCPCVEV